MRRFDRWDFVMISIFAIFAYDFWEYSITLQIIICLLWSPGMEVYFYMVALTAPWFFLSNVIKRHNSFFLSLLSLSEGKFFFFFFSLEANWDSPGYSVEKNPPAKAGDMGLILGSWIFPGEGNGNPFWNSWLGNPMDRGAWWDYSPWSHKRFGYNFTIKQQSN